MFLLIYLFFYYYCRVDSLWIFHSSFTDTVGGCISVDLLSLCHSRILLDCYVFSGPVRMQVFGLVPLCSVNITVTAHLLRLRYNEAVIL